MTLFNNTATGKLQEVVKNPSGGTETTTLRRVAPYFITKE